MFFASRDRTETFGPDTMTQMSDHTPIISILGCKILTLNPPSVRVRYEDFSDTRPHSIVVEIAPDGPRLQLRFQRDCDLAPSVRDEIKSAAIAFYGHVFGQAVEQ